MSFSRPCKSSVALVDVFPYFCLYIFIAVLCVFRMSAGVEAPPVVPMAPEVGAQVTPDDAAKDGGGEVMVKIGGHEGVVEPLAVDLVSSSQDVPKELPRLDCQLSAAYEGARQVLAGVRARYPTMPLGPLLRRPR